MDKKIKETYVKETSQSELILGFFKVGKSFKKIK